MRRCPLVFKHELHFSRASHHVCLIKCLGVENVSEGRVIKVFTQNGVSVVENLKLYSVLV